MRINIWMSIIGIAIAGGWLLLRGRRPEDQVDDADDDPAGDDSTEDADDSAEGGDDSDSGDAGVGVEEVEVTPTVDGVSKPIEGV